MEFTNRATKTYYSNFLKAVEKIKTINMLEKSAAYKSQLSQLEINLKNIQKFEPNLDLSELENEFLSFKNAVEGNDSQKSLDKDLQALQKSFDSLFLILNETKLNFDNIDSQVTASTKAIERDIAILEKNHPQYDTKPFRDKVADFQSNFKANLQNAASSNNNTLNLKEALKFVCYLPDLTWRDYEKEDFVYGSHNPTGDPYLPDYIWSQDAINTLQEKLKEYPKRVDEFIAKYDLQELNKKWTTDRMGKVTATVGASNYEDAVVATFLNNVLENISIQHAKMRFQEAQEVADFDVATYFNRAIEAQKVINASKIFTHDGLKEIASIYKQVVETMGDVENYRELILKNTLKLAKKVFMQKAKTENALLEDLVKIGFESRGWKEQVLKVHLLDFDWRLERNRDFVLGRVLSAAIATKKENGLCMLYTATIRQEDIGEGFAQPFLYSYTSKYIAEENI